MTITARVGRLSMLLRFGRLGILLWPRVRGPNSWWNVYGSTVGFESVSQGWQVWLFPIAVSWWPPGW
jgi:hypothetical protein